MELNLEQLHDGLFVMRHGNKKEMCSWLMKVDPDTFYFDTGDFDKNDVSFELSLYKWISGKLLSDVSSYLSKESCRIELVKEIEKFIDNHHYQSAHLSLSQLCSEFGKEDLDYIRLNSLLIFLEA